MNNAFTLRVPAAPADLFATLFALAFASLLTGLTLAAIGVGTPLVTAPALASYALLTALTLGTLRYTAS
jgi:hypothetical protein